MHQLSNPQINIAVFAYRPLAKDSDTIYYSISVTNRQNQTWLLEKRYSEFEQLDKDLKSYFQDTLPQLPKKTYITKLFSKSHEQIEERRQGLDEYLKVNQLEKNKFIQNLVVRQEVFHSLPLVKFLELDKNAKNEIVESPKLIKEYKNFLHGIRDFHYQSDLMFVLNSDMNVLTRLDAYLANMKMPWQSENGEQAVIPVSFLECWKIKSKSELEKVWEKRYNSQAICMYWDDVSNVILVGLDSGSVNYIHLDDKKYDESIEIEQHVERVMGVYFDKGLIHSISKDQRYRVLNIKNEVLVADYEPSAFELTYMKIWKERNRLLIGDKNGSIFIFNIEQEKPQAISQLSSTANNLRGICIENKKNYLFGLAYESGELVIFDMGLVNREQYAKEVGKLSNKEKSRELCYSVKRSELFVGNEDGTITIWDVKRCVIIYVLKAHDDGIRKLEWIESDQLLISGSKDKSIKVWELPKVWKDQKIIQEEIQKAQLQQKAENVKQMQNEDEDDLQRWNQD